MNATHSSSSSGGSGIGSGPLGYGNTPTCYFVMIGTKDNPIYEAEFPAVNTARSSSGGATIPEAKVRARGLSPGTEGLSLFGEGSVLIYL